MELPRIESGKVNPVELRTWISEMIKKIYSVGFNFFSRNQMTYEQTIVYCSENVFKNLVRVNKKYYLTAADFAMIDNHIRNGVLHYMKKKYPLTDNEEISKKFEREIQEKDNMEALPNNFLSTSHVVFEYREDGNYNDLIMKMLNELMGLIDN